MSKSTHNSILCTAPTAGLNALTRRRFFGRSLAAVAALSLPNPGQAKAQGPSRKPDSNKSVLMICDYQLGVGDDPYAKTAAPRAAAALAAARKAGMLVVFSKVTFRPGYIDLSPRNKHFFPVKAENGLPLADSRLIPLFQPLPSEVVVNKDRYNAFTSNDLTVILRSQGIVNLVVAGVATSGVVLSTFCAATDADYSMTILSDACADPQPALHQALITDLFPRSATVLTVDAWTAGLKSS